MAKTLKFNLIFGEKQIRTLEDLQENFYIQDVYPYYKNGLLVKWLNLQGLTEYILKINKINKDDQFNAINELIDIFLGKDSPSAVTEFKEFLSIEDKSRNAIEEYSKKKKSHSEFIEGYFSRYNELVSSLLNENNLSKIKPVVKELVKSYMSVLNMDFRNLFNRLHDAKAFYPICHMLTYDFFRAHWLDSENADKDIKVIYLKLVELTKMIILADLAALDENIIPYIKRSNKSHDGSWEEIEFPASKNSGKRCMVLFAHQTASVRAYKDKENEYKGNEITNKFKFFDGLDYRYTDSKQYLIYVEV